MELSTLPLPPLPQEGQESPAERLKRMAQSHADAALSALAEVMNNDMEKGAARALAAKTMLDRGFGAPERRVESKVDVSIIDHRQAHLEALQRLAKRQDATETPMTPIEDAEFTVLPRDR